MKSWLKLLLALQCVVLTMLMWAAVFAYALKMPFYATYHSFIGSGVLLFVFANLAGLILLLAKNGAVAGITDKIFTVLLWANPAIAVLVWLEGQIRTAVWLAWQAIISDSQP